MGFTAAGAFALSENSLYTVEAFREYFEHLKPDGIVAITRWEFQQPREALRVVSVAMQALHELGVADTRGNFMAVSEGSLNKDGIAVVVLAKRSPFTEEEQARVRAHVAANPRLFLLYAPSQRDLIAGTSNVASKDDEIYAANGDSFTNLIQLNDPKRFAARYPYDVSPVTDNAPFFLFQPEIRTSPASRLAAARHGLESQSGSGCTGHGSRHFTGGGGGISGCAFGDKRPNPAGSSGPSSVFRGYRPGIHTG